MILTEENFHAVENVLSSALGQNNAVPLQRLVELCNLPSRRAAEELMELRLQDFPFPVCSCSSGYYRAVMAAEINHYLRSLESRCRCLFLRRHTVIRAALRAGYQRRGRDFAPPLVPEQLDFSGVLCP